MSGPSCGARTKHPTAELRVRSQGSPCEVRGRRSDSGAGFSPGTLIPRPG